MGIVWTTGQQSEETLLPALGHYPDNVDPHTTLLHFRLLKVGQRARDIKCSSHKHPHR